MSALEIDFHDTATAFADKSNSALKERYRLFKMMNSPSMVSLGTKLTNFALAIGLPISGLIKRTVFTVFCGGETIEECDRTIKKLGESRIGTILDYSVEGKYEEEDFEHTKDEILATIRRAKGDPNIPFSVFKVTGIAPLGTLEKVSAGIDLPEKSQLKWERIQGRVREICDLAASIDQPIFIDAEETWIQNAIDTMAAEMMEKHNKERPLVYTTIQFYRTDALEMLKAQHAEAREKGYFYGIKLVRGAYMEKERDRAAEMGYPSPIQPDKASTDRDYDDGLKYCLENVETLAFVAATHNEVSTRMLVRLMEDKEMPKNHPHVFFSQLLGMSDNLSYVLSDNGYNVSKYVPYGPVRDSVPYLIRRAQENTAVMGQVSRELDLIKTELERRRTS
ncbi:MAG TPA: proline dehydrogenase family protein [Pyrinomonadaceae bacterium]|nr:proline dehydrogenase family protein [Pyrinomonadaceae bacterium]